MRRFPGDMLTSWTADPKGYFDSIPHDRLMRRLEEKIAEGPTLRRIDGFLEADILDEAKWRGTGP